MRVANKVILSEEQLLILKEVAPEVDKFTIGDEGSNPPVGGNFYHVDENLDLEVDSSEVDLSSFKKRDTMAPKLWDGHTLDSRARLKLLDIADDFWKFVNLTWVKPKGIILTGSICNFNWSDKSDIDLHLIVDFSEVDDKVEFVRDYMDSKKNEWNNEHDGLKIYGFPVELYVQNVGEMPKSSGIYDLEEDKWISAPSKDDIKPIKLNKFSIKDKAAKIMTIIDDMCSALDSTDDSHKVDEIGEDADYLWKRVKDMRRKSLDKYGESGSGNITYKALRRYGYLDKLFDLRNKVYDRSNSIFENKELIKEYLDYTYNEPLVQYFKYFTNASGRDKAYDLAHEIGYLATSYMERIVDDYPCFDELINLPFDYTDEEHIDAFVNMLDENDLCDHYIDISMDMVGDNNELPSWVYMQYNDTVKNEWCIHFGRDSYKIATNGFTNGTDDYSHLSYTSGGDGIKGFNFAFRLNNDKVNGSWYGNQAVIFRTSGVEVYHYGDDEYQVIFYGPYAHDFIPITRNGDDYDSEWQIMGRNGKVLYSSLHPSDVAKWATENFAQYRKQIMYDKVKPNYRFVEGIERYKDAIMLLKEETVADGNSKYNPYKKRWDAERKALKDFICNFGKLMTSKENGKTYKVYYDKTLSDLVGYNYCICLQWDQIEMKPKSILYIRALDKFTERIFTPSFDNRGYDNVYGTSDDAQMSQQNAFTR